MGLCSSQQTFLLMLAAGFILVDSFHTSIAHFNTRVTVHNPHALWAKSRPTANFDLKQIERFERQLDAEALAVEKDDADDVDDADDDTDDDDISCPGDNTQLLVVPDELDGKRIDSVIAELEPSISRSICGNLVSEGNVKLVFNKKQTVISRKAHKVSSGDVLSVTIPKGEKPTEIVAQDLPLDILFEDEHMIVLNKAAGMVVHPAAGNWDGTVVNALAFYLSNKSPFGVGEFVGADTNLKTVEQADDPAGADGEMISFRPGIVHRLDKGTTGILVVAKTTQSLGALSTAFAEREVKKTYIAITVGNPGKQVAIDKPIGRHPIKRQKMRVVPDPHQKDSSGTAPKDRLTGPTQKGKRALSYVDTLAFDGKLSIAQVRIETGRTHQIRVHLQDRNTPIYGDDVYGIEAWNKRLLKDGIARPLLHAYKLELSHPITGEKMAFTAPMAQDMKEIASKVWPQGAEEAPEIFA
jgi:23S rRNA pseudouridine1911/1915/1917 synthase